MVTCKRTSTKIPQQLVNMEKNEDGENTSNLKEGVCQQVENYFGMYNLLVEYLVVIWCSNSVGLATSHKTAVLL